MSPPDQDVIALSDRDRRLVEAEHTRLAQFLCDLCETCSESVFSADCHHCSKEKIASCQGRLPSYFYDFLELISEHFDHEEKIIGNSLHSTTGAQYLKQHQEAHAILLREVNRLIQDSAALSQQGNVAAAIREFYHLITDKFGEHTDSFDDPLIQLDVACAAPPLPSPLRNNQA